MPMTRTTISFTRDGMELVREAAKRQGSSASQFVREAALMRAAMVADDNPYPLRALAAQLRVIGFTRQSAGSQPRGHRIGTDGGHWRTLLPRVNSSNLRSRCLLAIARPRSSGSSSKRKEAAVSTWCTIVAPALGALGLTTGLVFIDQVLPDAHRQQGGLDQRVAVAVGRRRGARRDRRNVAAQPRPSEYEQMGDEPADLVLEERLAVEQLSPARELSPV